jgi:3-hydroxyisobutyrate dehydrogenase
VYEVITNSTGVSWMFEDRGAQIVNGDYAPRSPIDIIVKDLGIVVFEAELLGSSVPLANAALALFSEASDEGFGGEDGSAVAKLLGKKAGVELP